MTTGHILSRPRPRFVQSTNINYSQARTYATKPHPSSHVMIALESRAITLVLSPSLVFLCPGGGIALGRDRPSGRTIASSGIHFPRRRAPSTGGSGRRNSKLPRARSPGILSRRQFRKRLGQRLARILPARPRQQAHLRDGRPDGYAAPHRHCRNSYSTGSLRRHSRCG
jgi:hypothetical protein